MKKILVLNHHHGVNYYDASTASLEKKAFVSAFNFMKEGEYYVDVRENSEVQEWKEEVVELQDFLDSKKIPKSLGITEKEVAKKIDSLNSNIRNSEEEAELYESCLEGDPKAIKEFMQLRMNLGAESEDFEFAEVE